MSRFQKKSDFARRSGLDFSSCSFAGRVKFLRCECQHCQRLFQDMEVRRQPIAPLVGLAFTARGALTPRHYDLSFCCGYRRDLGRFFKFLAIFSSFSPFLTHKGTQNCLILTFFVISFKTLQLTL